MGARGLLRGSELMTAAANIGAQDAIGLWDQWCVLSEEPYVKTVYVNGEPVDQQSLLNEANCRLLLENFAAQKDDLPCTLGHQLTTADKAKYKVAEYNAMALFLGGQCVAMASHEAGLAQPTIDLLPSGDNGDAPEDGIYVHRKFLTDLGKACWDRRAVKKTSPEFMTDAVDQHKRPIGPQAQGLAWTDSPFLDGCEIKYERSTGMHKKFMEAGVMESDDPKTMSKKLFAHYGRTGMNKAGCMESDRAEDVVSKFSAHMESEDAVAMESGDADKDKGQDHKEPDKDNKVEMQSDPIVQKGAPTYIDQPGPNNKVVYEKDNDGARQTINALSDRNRQLEERLVRMEKDSAAREVREKATAARSEVDRAWRAGQIVPQLNETDEQARQRFFEQYTEFGEKAFKRGLAKPGTHSTRDQMSDRLTIKGLPVNFERAEIEMEADRPDEEILRLIAEKRKAGAKGDTLKLARQVCMERPALSQAYRNQSKAALFA